jgi:GDP-L-fucose synthase
MSERWATKRVCVTGGAGFLGSYVADELRRLECKNVFIPRSREYDLRDSEAIERMYNDAQPDIVIHLAAAVGGIGPNWMNPGRFFYDNLVMGMQLMEKARRRGVEKFVAIGTVCSYPKLASIPFREEELWNDYPEEVTAPYGMAKKALLAQGQAYRKQYDFDSIHLLPVNLYGPRDNFDPESSHVMPALIRKCAEAKLNNERQVVVWGSGTATREFLHVADCARAIRLAAERYDKPEPVNIGTGREVSIKDLVEMIAEFTGFQGEIIWDASKPDGQPRRCLDTSAAEKEFGFRAQVDLEAGVRQTVQWYLQSLKQGDK